MFCVVKLKYFNLACAAILSNYNSNSIRTLGAVGGAGNTLFYSSLYFDNDLSSYALMF